MPVSSPFTRYCPSDCRLKDHDSAEPLLLSEFMGGRAQWLQKLYKVSRRTIKNIVSNIWLLIDKEDFWSMSILNILYDNAINYQGNRTGEQIVVLLIQITSPV